MPSIEFIVVIVIAVILYGLNSRLKRVEKELKTRDGQRNTSALPTTSVREDTVSLAGSSTSNNVSQNFAQPATILSSSKTPTAPSGALEVSSEEKSGRILGGIGIAAVIVGVSFFLKYAFENNWVGPSGRVMIGIIIGVILLGIGQFLRSKYVKYSDLLMGGGIGILYLSVFSAYSFYSLISSTTAGVFMFVITALTFAISIANATMVLAFVGVLGGFITPFLVSSGNNSMLELFTYLSILNLGIMGISFFKKWPVLIVVAFIGTLFNFSAWFVSYYHSSDFLVPTLIFCFISFLIFLVSAVARGATSKTATDGLNYFLLGGNALAMATMGYMLLKPDYNDSMGFAAVFIAIIYMIVAFIINKSNPSDKALNIFLPGLAVVFLSIAVPLQFSGSWIAVAWIVESVFLYGIASVISNRGFQVMGVIVYCLGLFNIFVFNFPIDLQNFVVFVNAHFITVALAVIAAYAIAFMYYKFGSLTTEVQKRGIIVFIVIANVLTVYALSSQIIFYHNAKLVNLSQQYSGSQADATRYNTGYDNSTQRQQALNSYNTSRESITNQSNTSVSILWILYAAILTAVGFGKRIISARRMGLALFIITAIKVLLDVWSLGQVYRIVSFIIFGVVALGASFFYIKYKDRL